jgi:hypothetical protein
MTANKKEGFEYSKRGRNRMALKHSFANWLIYSLGMEVSNNVPNVLL